MKYLVLFVSLFVLNGCDLFTFSCGAFGSDGWFVKTLVIDRPIRDVTIANGETRTIYLDWHMHVDAVYKGDEACEKPDFKFIPDYTVVVDDEELANASITLDKTKKGRFGGNPKVLTIDVKSGESTKLILTARWFLDSYDEAGTSLYGTEDFEIEIIVTP